MPISDGAPEQAKDLSHVTDAVPKVEPRSPYGNPPQYEQDGFVYHVLNSAKGYKERGGASWYGTKFHGERTSSGETYDMYSMTAAHKTLPLPSYVRVTNLTNGRQVVVKVNDRGPFKEGRIIDLSYAAAVKLGYHLSGVAQVEVEAIVPEGTHKITAPSEIPEGKQIYVQVGAFSDHKKAQHLAKVIQQQVPWKVSLSEVRIRGNRLKRLRIGPLTSTEDANQLIETLSIPELGTPKVVFE